MIETAFGSHPKSLGIIIVKDLPSEYPSLRENLLKFAYKFASLPESVKEKYVDPTTRYSFGWSHGKVLPNFLCFLASTHKSRQEIMNGKPGSH